jgi:hypothetical protein
MSPNIYIYTLALGYMRKQLMCNRLVGLDLMASSLASPRLLSIKVGKLSGATTNTFTNLPHTPEFLEF